MYKPHEMAGLDLDPAFCFGLVESALLYNGLTTRIKGFKRVLEVDP